MFKSALNVTLRDARTGKKSALHGMTGPRGQRKRRHAREIMSIFSFNFLFDFIKI